MPHRFSDFAALLDRLKKGGVPGGGNPHPHPHPHPHPPPHPPSPPHQERRLHFSVAWSLEPLPQLAPSGAAPPALGGSEVTFDQVACKIGERVTVFRLKPV